MNINVSIHLIYERHVMFKKSILCLALAFCMLFSSCAIETQEEEIVPIKVVLPEKNEVFCPQYNLVEYVLDSSIKKLDVELFKNRKITIVGFDTNLANQEVVDDFMSYFVSNLESNVCEIVPISESDTILNLELSVNAELSSPKIKKVSEPKMIYAGLGPMYSEPETIEKEPHELHAKMENILVTAVILILDKDTEEILHYDTIKSLSVYNSKGIKSQH